MAKIVMVSGIHTAGDRGGMVNLANRLRKRGHTVRVYAYPSRWAISIYRNSVRARDAAGLYHFCDNDGDEVIISHSNGSLVTQNAMLMGLNAKGWISFGGAATSDKVVYSPQNFDWAISVYNPHDVALWFGARLPWHPFGRLGSEGYRGGPDGIYDKRWRNVNGASSGRWKLNHSHYTGEEIELWDEFCHNNANLGHSQRQIIRK